MQNSAIPTGNQFHESPQIQSPIDNGNGTHKLRRSERKTSPKDHKIHHGRTRRCRHKSIAKGDGAMGRRERKLSIWGNKAPNGLLAEVEEQQQQIARIRLEVSELLALPLLPDEDRRSAAESELERCECVWSHSEFASLDQNDQKMSEEFCRIAKSHCGLEEDQALELLQKCQFSLQFALIQLEQFAREKQRQNAKKWSETETEQFVGLLAKHRRDFGKIARKMPERRMPELVEHYYELKMERCPSSVGTSFVRCPWMKLLDTDHHHQHEGIDRAKPTIPREKCHNCCQGLWRDPSTVSIDMSNIHWRKRPPLCLPCDLYAKLFKMHRACALPLEIECLESIGIGQNTVGTLVKVKREVKEEDSKDEGWTKMEEEMKQEPDEEEGKEEDEEAQKGGAQGQQSGRTSKRTVEQQEPNGRGHEERRCWLARALGRAAAAGTEGHRSPAEEWTEEEQGICLAGFRRFGKDFEAISCLLERRNVEDVIGFFLEFQLEHRLDRLIGQSAGQQQH